MSADLHGRARADALRTANDQLDVQLRSLATAIPAEYLHTDPGDGQWTLAENLAHIAEFSRFFTQDLASHLGNEGAAVGRTHEHPGRNAAIAAAAGQSLDDLRTALDAALDVLAAQLGKLHSEDLDRLGNNRKYGPEPLQRFLDRYVLEHKAAHAQQLETTINAVTRSQ